MSDSKGGRGLIAGVVPVSVAKAKFSELARKASMGLEIVSANKHAGAEPVSIVKTDIVTAALGALRFTLVEERDEELGLLTISLTEIPIYGEGQTREEAVESLVDAALDYSRVYEERIELFGRVDSALTQAYMLKLVRCAGDRAAIRQALSV